MIRFSSKTTFKFCCLFVVLVAVFIAPRWEQSRTETTLSWDVSGYYMYLPATFIYHDLKHNQFGDSIIAKYHPTPTFEQSYLHAASGNRVMKYSAGQAVVMSPFFFIAHVWAKNSATYPADGFSFPYQICIALGMMLIGLIGIFFLRKILIIYFKDQTVSILLILYLLGTNYLNYIAVDQAMTHNPLFTIYALLIYTTIRFYSKPSYGSALSIGLLAGLATLIRPTDIVCILIPLCWNVSTSIDLKSHFRILWKQRKKLFLAAIGFIMVAGIQLVYWKWVTNQWLVYSYQDQGFSWLHPHIGDYTFSYNSGWLRYCPMMMLAIIGLIPFWKMKTMRLAVYLFLFVNFYIVCAWDIWDYGGTAGRAMVQSYPMLAFPFAALLEWVNRRRIIMYIFYPICLLFIYLNIWWTYNAHKPNLQVYNLSAAYYWHMLGRWTSNDYDLKLLDNAYSYNGIPDKFQVIYDNDFESDSSQNKVIANSGTKIRLNKALQFSQEYRIPKPAGLRKWLRFSADFSIGEKEWTTWRQAQYQVKFYLSGELVQGNSIRIYRFLKEGETKNVFIDVIPEQEWDQIGISFWNAEGDKEILIDNLKGITFDED